jgi:prevent-host-death family protein
VAGQIDSAPPRAWPIQETKARFSELLRACLKDGPQTLTRRGVPLAVLVSVQQWDALRRSASPTLKDLLLSGTGRTDDLVPPRTRLSRRPSPGRRDR